MRQLFNRGSQAPSDGDGRPLDAPVIGHPIPERPPLPRPQRVNRNALTIVAVIMGVLVIAAVVLVPPVRPPTAAPSGAQPADVPPSTYLDQAMPPVGTDGAPAIVAPGQGSGGQIAAAGAAGRHPTMGGASVGALTGDPYAAVAAPPPPLPIEAPVDPREGRYRAALEAPLVASAGDAGAAAQDDAWSGAAAGQGSVPIATLPVGDRHGHVMADAGRRSATVIATSVDPAPGPYALQAGTMIPAVLVTEINSDLPGEILAQVSRDVYDSRTQEAMLIPKGSKLLGKYDNQVAVAQDRLLVAWTRVIFPDGRSISLPGLATKDGAGAGGLHDRVDEHTGRVFGTAALLSLISAGAQLSQPHGGYGVWGAYSSAGEIAAGAAGQQLAEVATQMLRRNMDVQPTIRIRQGMPFNVFLSMDLTFAEPWMTRAAAK